jgi:hypothetical protein
MAETAATATPTDGGAQPEAQDTQPQTLGAPSNDPKMTAPDAKPAAEKPPEPRTYERKINGRVERIDADAIDKAAKALGLDPKEILTASQLKRAAYEQFEEARKIQKQMEALKGKEPWEIARELKGLKDEDLDTLAEQRLIAKLQREAMDPAQRKDLEERERFDKERAAFEAERKAHQETQINQQAQVIRARLEDGVIQAIEKAGLPKTPDSVRAVVSELERQHRYGLPLDIEDAVASARGSFVDPVVGMIRNMSAEQIVRELGEAKFKELLAYSLQPKGAPAAPQQTTPATDTAPPRRGRGYMTPKDWDAL